MQSLSYRQAWRPICQLHLKSNILDWSTFQKTFSEQLQLRLPTLVISNNRFIRICRAVHDNQYHVE
jgi:hypothetical protein